MPADPHITLSDLFRKKARYIIRQELDPNTVRRVTGHFKRNNPAYQALEPIMAVGHALLMTANRYIALNLCEKLYRS